MKGCYPLIDVGSELDVKPTLMALDLLTSIFLWAKLFHHMQDILLGVPRALTYTGSLEFHRKVIHSCGSGYPRYIMGEPTQVLAHAWVTAGRTLTR